MDIVIPDLLHGNHISLQYVMSALSGFYVRLQSRPDRLFASFGVARRSEPLQAVSTCKRWFQLYRLINDGYFQEHFHV